MAKPIHKYYRDLKKGDQYILCSKKKANFSEHVSYTWARVSCAKCLKLKKA